MWERKVKTNIEWLDKFIEQCFDSIEVFTRERESSNYENLEEISFNESKSTKVSMRSLWTNFDIERENELSTNLYKSLDTRESQSKKMSTRSLRSIDSRIKTWDKLSTSSHLRNTFILTRKIDVKKKLDFFLEWFNKRRAMIACYRQLIVQRTWHNTHLYTSIPW